MIRQVIVISGPDGADRKEVVRAALADEPVTISSASATVPEIWDPIVVLALLSPLAPSDDAFVTAISSYAAAGFPIVPVVDDLNTYKFDQVPDSLQVLCSRNAVALEAAAIALVVRQQLGLADVPQAQKVFISYRRSDADEVARAIYDDLWQHRYAAFLDTEQIEGGADVQQRIEQAIADKDFVLLLDSPAAAESEWVKGEILEAQARRIPIRVVEVGRPSPPLPLTSACERVSWDEANPARLELVRGLVSRAIGSRESFDRRFELMMRYMMRLKGLDYRQDGARQVILQRDRDRLLVQWEQAPVSLERLHRLYDAWRAARSRQAVLVAGDTAPDATTLAAVAWARGRAPLAVDGLPGLYSVVDAVFA